MIDKYYEIKSIDPIYWGKSGWIFLNAIALTYNPEYKDSYRDFFNQLPYILPCKSCGTKLKSNMINLEYALESKDNLLNWLINIRNEIYIDNGIPQYKKTIKDTFDEIFYKENTNTYISITISIVLLIILIILLKKSLNNQI